MTDLLWTIEAIRKAIDAETSGELPAGITGISIDSRTIGAGEAYFAIRGAVHDGHQFVAGAHANGGAVSVVAGDWVSRLEGETGPLLIVEDVLAALEKLGLAARARTRARIVAVTGSVGKTTTKEAMRTALAPSGAVHASDRSFNNHWGVPLTLARMPEDSDFGVFEIGMNHPNEISPLVKMVRPHVAVITNVAAVHLEAFDDVDGIAMAKSEIFDGLEPDGTALLNADDERIALLRDQALLRNIADISTFGEAEDADARIERLVPHASCTCLTADIFGEKIVVKIGAPGRHIAQNVIAALAVVAKLGADLARGGLAMADLRPVKGRGERHLLDIKGGRYVLIDESYNANPTSMRAALTMLGQASVQDDGRRIAILGDMLELGPSADALHAGLAESVLANGIDALYLAGPHMAALADALKGRVQLTHAGSIDDLIEPVSGELRAGDAVMVKASLGMGFAPLVSYLLEAGAANV